MTYLIGQQIEHYQIEALLGEGGMGTVYRAIDLRRDQVVALKVMHTHLSHQPQFQQRFAKEAQAASNFNSPSIIRIYDYNTYKDIPYITMEYIPGGSLTAYLKQLQWSGKRLSLDETILVAAQVAEGLAYAHQRGVIHRDIKPDNILLKLKENRTNGTTNHQIQQAVLTDFGLAILMKEEEATTNPFMGSLPYMSPEQCSNMPLDGRSDIYSLGVMLYQLTTGQLPFKIEAPADIVKHLQETPLPPRLINPEIPPSVEVVITKSLAKKQSERYQTGAELAHVLRQIDLKAAAVSPQYLGEQAVTQWIEKRWLLGVEVQNRIDVNKTWITEGDFRVLIAHQWEESRIAALNKPTIHIGRGPENDIILDDRGVSGQHVRLDKVESGWQVRDLGSTNGTYLDNAQLEYNKVENWYPTQTLNIGPYSLKWQAFDKERNRPVVVPDVMPHTIEASEAVGAYQQAASPSQPAVQPVPMPVVNIPSGRSVPAGNGTPSLPTNGAGGGQHPSVSTSGDILDITLMPSEIEVEPGTEITIQVKVQNHGLTVEDILLRVEENGMATTWLTLLEGDMKLLPDESKTVLLRVEPPRDSQVPAGEHIYHVIARTTKGEQEVVEGKIIVGKWEDFLFDIHPVNLRENVTCRLTLSDRSNFTNKYDITGRDDNDALVFDFKDPQDAILLASIETEEQGKGQKIKLDAGTDAKVGFVVKPKKRPWFRTPDRPFPFTVRVRTETTEEWQELDGQLEVSPRISRRLLLFLILLALVLGVLSYLGYGEIQQARAERASETQAIAEAFNATAEVLRATAGARQAEAAAAQSEADAARATAQALAESGDLEGASAAEATAQALQATANAQATAAAEAEAESEQASDAAAEANEEAEEAAAQVTPTPLPPPSNITLDNLSVLEEADIGLVVGKFTVIINTGSGRDPDSGVAQVVPYRAPAPPNSDNSTVKPRSSYRILNQSGSVIYSLVSGSGDQDNSAFFIEGDTLKTAIVLDYETKSSYTIRVQVDNGFGTFEKQFTLLVTDVNDPPAFDSTAPTSATENSIYTYDVVVLDPDADEDLSISAASLPSWLKLTDRGDGTATLSGTPTNSNVGTHNITLEVEDSDGETDEQSFVINVSNVNNPPEIDSVAVTQAIQDELYGYDITAVDPDRDEVLTFTALTKPTWLTFNDNGNGTAQLSGTPTNDNVGNHDVLIQVQDSGGSVDVQNFTVNVTDVNDEPTATDDTYTTSEDTTFIQTSPGILSNDEDVDGDTLTVVLVDDVNSGDLTLNNDGSFTLTPFPNFCGTDTFTYRTNDGTADSNEARVTVSIVCVNDAPIANNGTFTVDEDTVLNDVVDATDVDQTDTLVIQADSNPTYGILTMNTNGAFTYNPNQNFCSSNNSDSFTYHASDGTTSSNTAINTILVTCVNDAPVAVADGTYFVDEDGSLNVSVANGVLANDTDIEGDTLQAQLDDAPAHGNLNLSPDGSFTYTPNPDYCNNDQFTYHANDTELNSQSVNVNIEIRCINDPPAANNDSYTTSEDDPLSVPAPGVLANDVDVKGQALTAILDTGPSNGTLTLSANGGFDYTPNDNFCGIDSFTYHAHDGTDPSNIATVNLPITCVNDPPNAVNDNDGTTEDGPAVTDVLANDSDIDGNLNPSTVDVTLDPTDGTITNINPATGEITYMPDANFEGQDTYRYIVCDTGTPLPSQCDEATVTIDVDAVNDPPTANNDTQTTIEDMANTVDVLANDSDIDGSLDVSSLTIDTPPGNGSTSVNTTTGEITYTPAPDFFGSDSYIYEICDTGTPLPPQCSTATVAATVTPVNDAPVNTLPASQTTQEDVSLTFIAGTGNEISISDDSGANPIEVTLQVDTGTLTLSGITGLSFTVGDGTDDPIMTFTGALSAINTALDGLVYDPPANFFGTTLFTMITNDQGYTGPAGIPAPLTDTDTMTVNINFVNDPPNLDLNGTAPGDGYTATFTEDGGGVSIVSTTELTITDIDNTTMSSAVIAIENIQNAGSEILAVTLTGGITSTYDSNTGVLTLNGVSPIANYETVLRSITYNNTSNAPGITARIINFTVNDGTDDSNIPVSTVSVVAINDPPVLDLNGGAPGIDYTATFVEDGGDVDIVDRNNLTLIDPDNGNMVLATISITNRQDGTAEILDATATGGTGITVSFDSINGVLTLSNLSSAANYRQVLRTVTYENTSNMPNTAVPRTVTFVVEDAAGGTSTVATSTITVMAANDPPVLDLDDTSGGNNYSTAFTEDGGAVPIVNPTGLTVTDGDSTTMNSATITLVNQPDGTAETLSANVGSTGIITTYNAGVLTLSGVDTIGNYEQVLRTVNYRNTSNNPNTTNRTVEFVVNDGIDDSNIPVSTININPTNDAPVLGNIDGGTISYTEGDPPIQVDNDGTVNDIDSTNFNGGALTIEFTGGSGTADDRLIIVENSVITLGDCGGGSTRVCHNGVRFGTFSGGTNGSTPLVIALDRNEATPVRTQDLLRQISYYNVSGDPSPTDRTVRFTLTDGDGGTSNQPTVTVQVIPVFQAPVITGITGAVGYTEGDAPVRIDTNNTLLDGDSPHFSGGTLTVNIMANGTLSDRLVIDPGVFSITISGTEVLYFGDRIGDYSGGTDGFTPLVVTLDTTDATINAVESLIQHIAYENIVNASPGPPDPSPLDRTVQYTLVDGDGATSNQPTKLVQITAALNGPPIGHVEGTVHYTESVTADGGAVLLDTEATITDIHSSNLNGGTLTAAFTANGTAYDRLAIRPGAGITLNETEVRYNGSRIGSFSGGTSGFLPLKITFDTAQATPTAVQTLLRQIEYNNVVANPGSPSPLDRTVQFTLTNSNGLTSHQSTVTVVITTVPDAPVIGNVDGIVPYTEGAVAAVGAVLLDTNGTVTDADSTDFKGGTFTVAFTANGTLNDRLTIRPGGNISTLGTEVRYNGSRIGSFTGGMNGFTPLRVTFDSAQATPTAVQALLRQIEYNNIAANPGSPSPLDRTVQFTLVGGDGLISNQATLTIKVTIVPDAPALGNVGGVVNYAVNPTTADTIQGVLLDTDGTVTDADSSDFSGGSLTIEFAANGTSSDQLAVRPGGGLTLNGIELLYNDNRLGTFTGGDNGFTPLVITFDTTYATPAAVQTVLRQIEYRHISTASESSGISSRIVRLTLVDGNGAASNQPVVIVQVATTLTDSYQPPIILAKQQHNTAKRDHLLKISFGPYLGSKLSTLFI